MKTKDNFTTELSALTTEQREAVTNFSGKFIKTFEVNIGCNVDGVPYPILDTRRIFMNYLEAYTEQLEEDFVFYFKDEFFYKHTEDTATEVHGPDGSKVEISEDTIYMEFCTNFPLSTLTAILQGACHILQQDAIPMVLTGWYVDADWHPAQVEFIQYGQMIGRTKATANKWGKFNAEYFIS